MSRMSPGSARSVARKNRVLPSCPTVAIQFVSPAATVCAHCQLQTVSTSVVAAKRSSTVPEAKRSDGQASVSETSLVPVEMAAKWRALVDASRSGGDPASLLSDSTCEDGESEVSSPPVRFCASIVAITDRTNKTTIVVRFSRHSLNDGNHCQRRMRGIDRHPTARKATKRTVATQRMRVRISSTVSILQDVPSRMIPLRAPGNNHRMPVGTAKQNANARPASHALREYRKSGRTRCPQTGNSHASAPAH